MLEKSYNVQSVTVMRCITTQHSVCVFHCHDDCHTFYVTFPFSIIIEAIKKQYTSSTAAYSTPINSLFIVSFTKICGDHPKLNTLHHHHLTVRPAMLFLTET